MTRGDAKPKASRSAIRARGLRAWMACAAVAVFTAISLMGVPAIASADDAANQSGAPASASASAGANANVGSGAGASAGTDQVAASGSGAGIASSSSAQSASGQSSSSSSSSSSSAEPISGDSNRVDQSQRADNSFIYDTSIAALYSETSLYEGQTVQVVGEVVGDRITSESDPGFCWITVTEEQGDDSSSVSVLLSDELADQIDHYGKYNVQGTLLQVRGTFHEACSDHDGLSDIHATAAEVSQRGWENTDEFDAHALGIALACVFIGCIIVGAYYYERERQR